MFGGYAGTVRIRLIATGFAIALLGLCATAFAAAPGPNLATGDADQITDTSARVKLFVNDVADHCWVDYGTTPAFGSRVDVICGGTTYGQLTGLTPGTTYY